MEITGSYLFHGDQQSVWNILMNPDAIASAIPGVKELVPLENEAHAWRAEAKIGFSAISGTYGGFIHMSEINAPTSYRLDVKGEGQQSLINGHAVMTLLFLPDTHQTQVTWVAEAAISGKIARIGQRVIKAAASFLSRKFFNGLAQQLNPAAVLEDDSAPDGPIP
ncbi:MAG: carbon monoxide dehydrogenase subunit G [Anaerolineae bacterium]|jgi:hypothetical protein|nr:carbon monoxide dehydrogenase subunit G [Anaerolineae bacterium]